MGFKELFLFDLDWGKKKSNIFEIEFVPSFLDGFLKLLHHNSVYNSEPPNGIK